MKAAAAHVIRPLGFVWETVDPFLFCVHHKDHFPAGNARMAVADSSLLAGRDIGSDFTVKDGFRMYHGTRGVPGFPAHPHRGFETVTIVTQGQVDHHDSMGAVARYGGGGSDTQWLTTGNGIQHAEMMPLLNQDGPNPLELFQIWLNLPASHKFAKPHFTMLWAERNPILSGPGYKITVIADQSKLLVDNAQPPPPESWASQPGADVAMLLIDLDEGGTWTLPPSVGNQTKRSLYLFGGTKVQLDGATEMPLLHGTQLQGPVSVTISNVGQGRARLLMLQARPIGEPVVQRGPFVLNTQQELLKAFSDFQRTQFGGWPHGKSDPTLPRDQPRFARHPDGRTEYPSASPDKEL